LRGEETGKRIFRKMKIDLELKKPIESHLMVFLRVCCTVGICEREGKRMGIGT
jgi:hypothetical protein